MALVDIVDRFFCGAYLQVCKADGESPSAMEWDMLVTAALLCLLVGLTYVGIPVFLIAELLDLDEENELAVAVATIAGTALILWLVLGRNSRYVRVIDMCIVRGKDQWSRAIKSFWLTTALGFSGFVSIALGMSFMN